MTENNPVKYNDMSKLQQKLYSDLGLVIESWAKDNGQNSANGIKNIFEVLVTLTLSVKAFYLIKNKENSNNDVQSQTGT